MDLLGIILCILSSLDFHCILVRFPLDVRLPFNFIGFSLDSHRILIVSSLDVQWTFIGFPLVFPRIFDGFSLCFR